MSVFPLLETERLILRRFELSDAERIQYLLNDRDVALNLTPVPHPYTLQDAQDWITRSQADMEMDISYAFAIVRKSDGLLIGDVEVGHEIRNSRGELGYWLGKAYWGQGYMTEATRRMLRFAFENLRLNRVYCDHYARNPASGRVMQKIGMRCEGTLRGHVIKWGEVVDVVCYGILREEWEKQVVGG